MNTVKTQVSQSEFEALVAIYNATDGVNWNNNTNWDIQASAADVTSDWFGITVTGGTVTEINFYTNNLVGDIPPEIENLTSLTKLKLGYNQLNNIPAEIGNLVNLEELHLYGNNFKSLPTEIGQLSSVYYFNVYNNDLTSIPAEIGDLTSVTDMNIGANNLTNIPPEIGNLTTLTTLSFWQNDIETIPAEIGNLTSLTTLNLGGNRFSNIPIELFDLTNLSYLQIDNNLSLTTLPSEIGNLSSLTRLNLQQCRLASLPSEIGNLSNLIRLELGYNQSFSSIPAEIGNLSKLEYLNLEFNHLTSLPAEIGNLSSLKELYLNANNIADIPTELMNLLSIEKLNLGGNELSSLFDFSGFTGLTELYLASNNLVFEELEALNINWNELTSYSYVNQSAVPLVKTEDGAQITFTVNVGNNGTSYAWYKDNLKMAGETTSTLTIENTENGIYHCEMNNSNFPDLTLYSVKEPAKVTNGIYTSDYEALISLYDSTDGDNWVKNNNWKSDLPVSEWELVTVENYRVIEIDLDNNYLSGKIPQNISNLTELTHLSLKHNSITGIPKEIGELSKLKWFDIGYNLLKEIPDELSNLSSIYWLYLDHNMIISVPDLSSLTTLNYFRINDNYLNFGDISNLNFGSYINKGYAPQNLDTLNKTIVGDEITLTCNIGGVNDTYTWYKNDTVISGQNSISLILTNEEANHGVYYCKLTNPDFPYLTLKTTSEGIGLVNGVLLSDYNALVALYDSTNGLEWETDTNWKSDKPVYMWHGITVNEFRVAEIDLNNNRLSNKIPSEMRKLTSLQKLNVSGNSISGVSGEIFDLPVLTVLQLSNNSIDELKGDFKSNSLKYLYLNNNLLTLLSGEIGNLVSLIDLRLEYNFLTQLPPSINNMVALQKLYIHNNELTSLPDLSSLSSLVSFYLYNNYLDYGDFDNSQLNWSQVTIPLYSPQNLEIPVIINTESGSMVAKIQAPGLNNQYQWFKDDVDLVGETKDSLLIADSEQAIYYCMISNTDYSGLNLKSNTVLLPAGVSMEDYDALLDIYTSTNGDAWLNNSKWLSDAPVEEWYGIEVFDSRVVSIDLSENNLDGRIPYSIGKLTDLKALNLSNGKLEGVLPSSIVSLKKLTHLVVSENSLSQNIPSQITELKSLSFIILFDNQFKGLPDLSSLENVEFLSIANNQFTYEDIEPNINVASVDFDYSPQDSVGTAEEIIGELNNTYYLSVQVAGENNNYKWYRNNIEIPNSDNDSLKINEFSTADLGTYYCEVNNSIANELTLFSYPIQLILNGVENRYLSSVQVYPNPACSYLSINLNKQPIDKCIAVIYDINGKIVLNQAINNTESILDLNTLIEGTYFLQIIENNRMLIKKSIVVCKE